MPKAVAAAGPMPPRVVAALQRSSVQHPTFVIPCDDLLPPSTSALAVAAEGQREGCVIAAMSANFHEFHATNYARSRFTNSISMGVFQA